MKIRIIQNVWGNVNGYVGHEKVKEFGSNSYGPDYREWIAEFQAKGYLLGKHDVDIRTPEEKRCANRPFDILHDGRPAETLWAYSAAHALAIRTRKTKGQVEVTASERKTDAS